MDFGDYDRLVESLRGAATLYNTYWIRFARGTVTHDVAVQNSRILIGAAAEAGVSRIVHISITNPSEDSPLPYFRGKALVEKAIHESGLSYAILRPTVLFSPEDVLINNIAWFLRRFPAFPIAGSGDYPIQPVFVDDLAQLAVNAGAGSEDVVLDAVGPDRDSPDQTNFPGYSSFWDTVKYNPAFQGRQMRPNSLKFPVFI